MVQPHIHQMPYSMAYCLDTVQEGTITVENIKLNDNKNESEYKCLILNWITYSILNESDPTILYVADEFHRHSRYKMSNSKEGDDIRT